jgi:hypothetical protein
MAGEGRPSTSFRDRRDTDVDGGTKPRHDVRGTGASSISPPGITESLRLGGDGAINRKPIHQIE